MRSGSFEFISPVKINSGLKALETIPFELEALDAGKPLVLSHSRSAANTVIGACRGADLTMAVATPIGSPPESETIERLAKMYADGHCDAIVATGHGGVADTAKLVNLLVSTGTARLADIPPELTIPRPLKPLIWVPGLAVTGGEASGLVALDSLRIYAPFLAPDVAVVDVRSLTPEPVETILASAMTSLTLATEAIIRTDADPIAGAFAAAVVELIGRHILDVVRHPSHDNGRLAVANAAVLAGVLVTHEPPGLGHALGTAIGRRCGLSDGIAMGMVLPYVLTFNILKERATAENLLLPLGGGDLFAGTAEHLRSPIAVNMLHAMQYDLSKAVRGAVPANLQAAGVEKESLEEMAGEACSQSRSDCETDECLTILEHAWSGHPIVSV